MPPIVARSPIRTCLDARAQGSITESPSSDASAQFKDLVSECDASPLGSRITRNPTPLQPRLALAVRGHEGRCQHREPE